MTIAHATTQDESPATSVPPCCTRSTPPPNPLVSWVARIIVTGIYTAVALVVHTGTCIRRLLRLGVRGQRANQRCLLLTGTFYNRGWFCSHVLPFTRVAELDEVIVVGDEPLFQLDKVTYAYPPAWLKRVLGRGGARLLLILYTAWRRRPATLMGYHVMPNGLFCLIAAKILGLRAIYQMTGGPIQVWGGGHGSENILLRQLGRPSSLRQALLYHIVRQFDAVVVRGRRAREFVRSNRLAMRCLIVPGSVDCERFAPGSGKKTYDLVCVGRLVSVKRYDRVVRLVAALNEHGTAVRVAIIGDGPLLAETQALASELGVSEQLEFLGKRQDVDECLKQARAFLITSENEGLSIAMIEAMAAGLPALAPDVGDLSDLLIDGETGLFFDPENLESEAAGIAALLADSGRLARMSAAARRAAVDHASIEAVAARWSHHLTSAMSDVTTIAESGATHAHGASSKST